jgi:hypothetical protein
MMSLAIQPVRGNFLTPLSIRFFKFQSHFGLPVTFPVLVDQLVHVGDDLEHSRRLEAEANLIPAILLELGT